MTHAAKLGGMLLIASALAGCAPQTPAPREDFFAHDQPPLTAQTLQTQHARGARASATLYAPHFDGPRLNTLGRHKLEVMLKDNDSALPLTVYVDVPQPLLAQRQQAVQTHLTDAGLLPAQFKIETGANPASYHPVAPALKALRPDEANPNPSAAAPLNLGPLGTMLENQNPRSASAPPTP